MENLIFKIKGNEYVIETPTVGQIMRIEQIKIALTNGQYGNLLNTRTFLSEYALDVADISANFSVLCPELVKDMKVDNFKDLDPKDFNELRDAYKSQFIEWYSTFLDMLKGNIDEKKG